MPSRWLDDLTVSEETSLSLLARAQRGDAVAMEALMGRYLARLQRWASGRVPTSPFAARHRRCGAGRAAQYVPPAGRLRPRHDGALLAYLREAVANGSATNCGGGRQTSTVDRAGWLRRRFLPARPSRDPRALERYERRPRRNSTTTNAPPSSAASRWAIRTMRLHGRWSGRRRTPRASSPSGRCAGWSVDAARWSLRHLERPSRRSSTVLPTFRWRAGAGSSVRPLRVVTPSPAHRTALFGADVSPIARRRSLGTARHPGRNRPRRERHRLSRVGPEARPRGRAQAVRTRRRRPSARGRTSARPPQSSAHRPVFGADDARRHHRHLDGAARGRHARRDPRA